MTLKLEYYINLPETKGDIVQSYKAVLGENFKGTGYSLNEKLEIIQGVCTIKNNDLYDYHNNYDISEDELFFDGKIQYWSLNFEEIKNLQKNHIDIYVDKLIAETDRIEELFNLSTHEGTIRENN